MRTLKAFNVLAKIANLAVFLIAVYKHDWFLATLALVAGIDVKIVYE